MGSVSASLLSLPETLWVNSMYRGVSSSHITLVQWERSWLYLSHKVCSLLQPAEAARCLQEVSR